MNKILSGAYGFFCIILLLLPASMALCEDVNEAEIKIRQDLWKIREFRTGLRFDYNDVYAKANELLKKYSDKPDVIGRIYLEVLIDHAMSGLARPLEAIEYAKKAEQYPLSPKDKAQLYLSWGDAIQFTTPGAKGDKLRDTRRKATEKYLRSMKVLQDNNLPITIPDKPIMPPEANVMEDVMIIIPEGISAEAKKGLLEDIAALEERDKKRKDYFEALDQWTYKKEIIDRAVYSRDLIVKLYTTLPFDAEELQKLATEILGKSEMVDDMVSRVNSKIKDVSGANTSPVNPEVRTATQVKQNEEKFAMILPNGVTVESFVLVDGNKWVAFQNMAWSSDGKQIAFAGRQNDVMNIYTVNLEDSNQKRITNMPRGRLIWGPTYRPNSSQLYYMDNSLQGADFHWIAFTSLDGTAGRNTTLMVPGGHLYSPARFSPDGKSFCFSHNDRQQDYIKIADADGSNIKTILSGQNSISLVIWGRGINSDRLAFSEVVDNKSVEKRVHSIFTVKTDGSDEKRLTDENLGDCYVYDWSPDGKRIVFSVDNKQIFTINSNGTNLVQFTNDEYENEHSVFSPDGAKIAYISKRGEQCYICIKELSSGI